MYISQPKPFTIMKTPFIFRTFLLLIFALTIHNQLIAQPQPEDYIIVNKTTCTAQVTAYCTGFSSASNTLAPDEDWINSCPTGETLCWVSMTLPGSTTVTIETTIPSVICLNPGTTLPPNACYTDDYEWKIIGTYVVCNIY